MANIQVEKNGSLFDYGKTISQFISDFEVADADTRRQFSYKTDDAEGKAIQAFLERLNTIQTTVFDTYPQTLQKASEAYLTYSSALLGIGFNQRAWTSDTGVSTVAAKLRGQQVTTIHDVAKPLQESLNRATALLGTGKEDVTTVAEKAAETMRESASRRQAIDGEMQDAYSKFTEGLSTAESELKGLQAQLDNAHLSLSIPVAAVVNGIDKKLLTGETINATLDMIKNKDEAKLMTAVFADKPEDVAGVDPDKVSDEVMTVVYSYFFINVEHPAPGEDAKKDEKLTVFFNTLFSKYTGVKEYINKNGEHVRLDYRDYITRYSKKLLKAGDRYAVVTVASLLEKYPSFPRVEDYSDPNAYYEAVEKYEKDLEAFNNDTAEIARFKGYLKKMNSLNGLFQGLIVSEIDNKIVQVTTGQVTPDKRYHRFFELSKEGVVFDANGNGSFTVENKTAMTPADEVSRYTITSEILETEGAYDGAKLQESYRKLQEERSAAVANFVADLAQAGATLYSGPLGLSIGVIRGFVGGSASEVTEGVTDLAKKPLSEGFKKAAGFAGSALQSYFGVQEKIASLDKEQRELVEPLYQNLFGTGGIQTVGEVSVEDMNYTNEMFSHLSSSNYYNLESFVRQYEFQENGLRRYMYDMRKANAGGKLENLTTNELHQGARDDRDTLKNNLYQDSYEAAIGGEVPLADVDLLKFYAEMTGENKIPVPGDNIWNPFDGNGFIDAKTGGTDVFREMGVDEDSYYTWMRDSFAPYRMR